MANSTSADTGSKDESLTTDEASAIVEATTPEEAPLTDRKPYELEDLEDAGLTKNKSKVKKGEKDFTYIMIILLLVLLNCICCNCFYSYRSKGTIKHERENETVERQLEIKVNESSVEPEKDDGNYEDNERNCYIEESEQCEKSAEDDEELNATLNDATTLGQTPKLGIGTRDKPSRELKDDPEADIPPGTADLDKEEINFEKNSEKSNQ